MVVAETVVLAFIGWHCVKGGLGVYLYMVHGDEATKKFEEAMGCGKKPAIDEDHDNDPVNVKNVEEEEEGGGKEEGGGAEGAAFKEASDAGVGRAVTAETLETHSKDGL